MYYLIRQTLEPVEFSAIKGADEQYVAVLTTAEWMTLR